MGRLERACVQLLDCCEIAKCDPIVGDLVEERCRGKSRAWFLREMLILLMTGVGRQIASERLRSIMAILTGLAISIPLRTLLTQLDVIGGGSLQFVLMTSAVFALAGIAIRHKFRRNSVAMAAAFTAYALFAKVSLIALNFERFQSASRAAHLPLAVAAVMLPPVFAVAGAVILQLSTAKKVGG